MTCKPFLALVFCLLTIASLQSQVGSRITIFAPAAQSYEIALDELELSTASDPASRTQATSAVRDAKQVRRRNDAVVFQTSAASVAALASIAQALESANPGARAEIVLYPTGEPRTAASRRVLTREVAVLLNDDADRAAFQQQYARFSPKPFPGIGGAFVLTADDPLAAVDLADTIRIGAAAAHAYPLLRQQYSLQ